MYNFYTGLASVANWTVPSPMTICKWVILRGYNAAQNRLFGTADNFETKFVIFGEDYQGDLFENSGSPLPSSPAGVGVRLHLAFTGTIAGSVKSYLNGVLDVTDSSLGGTPSSPATLGVGGRSGSSDVANGDLEDVRVYNRELSANEILTIYTSNGRDNIYDGLINRWAVSSKGDGTDISTDYIYDLTGSKQHLQKVSNAVYYRGGFISPRRRV
jgi:hypothetical protein